MRYSRVEGAIVGARERLCVLSQRFVFCWSPAWRRRWRLSRSRHLRRPRRLHCRSGHTGRTTGSSHARRTACGGRFGRTSHGGYNGRASSSARDGSDTGCAPGSSHASRTASSRHAGRTTHRGHAGRANGSGHATHGNCLPRQSECARHLARARHQPGRIHPHRQTYSKQSLPLADHEVVITFDDGPLPPYSNVILDTLASQCVKATYFIVGQMAKANPWVLRRMYNEGHTIGTHSLDHPLGFERLALPPRRARGRGRHRLGRRRYRRPESGVAVFPHSGPWPLQGGRELPRLAASGDLERRRGRGRTGSGTSTRSRS